MIEIDFRFFHFSHFLTLACMVMFLILFLFLLKYTQRISFVHDITPFLEVLTTTVSNSLSCILNKIPPRLQILRK